MTEYYAVSLCGGTTGKTGQEGIERYYIRVEHGLRSVRSSVYKFNISKGDGVFSRHRIGHDCELQIPVSGISRALKQHYLKDTGSDSFFGEAFCSRPASR